VGRAPLLIALAAAAVLVPAAPAQGPAEGAARWSAPLPPPGPMAQRRVRWGGGPRGDVQAAAQRSPSGRRIRVHFHGSGTARSRVLVVGCINGRRCAGRQIGVGYECPPDDAEFWWIPTLRPEGADLDRVARHPGAAMLRQAVADLRPRVTILYRTGLRAVVRASGSGEAEGRRYARVAGLPFSAAPAPGLAAWIQRVRPGSAAITVELPAARLRGLERQRHAFAAQRLAGTRFVSPVHEARTPGGTVSLLTGRHWRSVSGGRLPAGADLALASTFPARDFEAPARCSPAAVQRRLGRYGTLLLVSDRGDAVVETASPPRPRHLRLGTARWVPCLGRAHVIRFSDAGRSVQAIAAFGRDANRWTRRGARAALDSLRVEA
jgi:hypothetical protein